MPVRQTGAGIYVTGLGALPARYPNTLSDKYDITPSRGTWEWGTSKRTQGYIVPVSVKATVMIENPDELQKIAEAANLTVNYLAREAANAALDLYQTAEELLADEVKGKVRIDVVPSSDEGYWVEAVVLTEPATRRPGSNATIPITAGGRMARSSRFVNTRQVGSITTYVAQQMHRSFDEAIPKVKARSTAAVQQHIKDACKAFGVKVNSKGIGTVPSGGIEFAGKFYSAGSKITLG